MSHQDGVIEAARTIDNSLGQHPDDRHAGLTEVNSYLAQNPTFGSDQGRASALTQALAVKGDLPDLMVDEFTKSAADRANDPLAQVLDGTKSALGSSDSEIQKNAKALGEGLAAREGLQAFTNDDWNKMFKGGSASHDDIKHALNDQTLNLNGDQRKALADIDANFDALRVSGWHFWSNAHKITRDRLQDDLDKTDGGIRGKELAAVDGIVNQAKDQAQTGNVTVNVENGEGWQNVAAKALGYDVRLRTQDDWKAVPQMDINKIYGLANYFSQQNPKMLQPGKMNLTVPQEFQIS